MREAREKSWLVIRFYILAPFAFFVVPFSGQWETVAFLLFKHFPKIDKITPVETESLEK